MPTDRLAFAVFVRRQEELAGVFEQSLSFLTWLLAVRDDVERVEVLVHIDAQVGPPSLLYSAGISLAPCGRSRTWPMLASTVYPRPRNLEIVRALAGDSTITRALRPDVADFFAMLSSIRIADWANSKGCVKYRRRTARSSEGIHLPTPTRISAVIDSL